MRVDRDAKYKTAKRQQVPNSHDSFLLLVCSGRRESVPVEVSLHQCRWRSAKALKTSSLCPPGLTPAKTLATLPAGSITKVLCAANFAPVYSITEPQAADRLASAPESRVPRAHV